ncbi:5120_t:CDS:2 [Diversispora eburnea]|uniref:5120_t:CDS:1 n=1 Tax=Diversispora eburnea TaxID=1213867 RepID=A0A9N8ZCE7_9GLOM|nr:5120_t:CDS:2 [Diversispora eburnea]
MDNSLNSLFPEGLKSHSQWNFLTFDPLKYIYFNVAFIFIAYPLYWLIAGFFSWELARKSPCKHFSDVLACVRYGFIVFVLGAYSVTFSWNTVISFYIAIFGYALLAELPFARESLPTWPIKFQKPNNSKFLWWYLGSLTIPIILILMGILVTKEHNDRILTKKYIKIKKIIKIINIFKKSNNEINIRTELISSEPRPYLSKTRIHIHHWQIFYVLAFFTRFNHPISQIGGGIVLGIYSQGMIAGNIDPERQGIYGGLYLYTEQPQEDAQGDRIKIF